MDGMQVVNGNHLVQPLEIIKVGGICQRCNEPSEKRGRALVTEGNWAVQHYHLLCRRCHEEQPIEIEDDPEYNIEKLYANHGCVRAVTVPNETENNVENTDKSNKKKEADTATVAPQWESPELSEYLQTNLPEDCQCPITHEPMHHPVVATDGHTYEEFAITKWLTKQNKSPKSGETLKNKTLIPNYAIRSQIQTAVEAFKEKKKAEKRKREELTKETIETENKKTQMVICPYKRRQRL